MARPKQDKYKLEYMLDKINEYLELCIKTDSMPISKECFLNNGWEVDYVYQLSTKEGYELLSSAIKKITDLKSIYIEKKLLDPNIKPAGMIFLLKQLGYKDVNGIEIEKSSGVMDLVKSIQEMKNENKS